MGGIITIIIILVFVMKAAKANEDKKQGQKKQNAGTTSPRREETIQPAKSVRSASLKPAKPKEQPHSVRNKYDGIMERTTQNVQEDFSKDTLLMESDKHSFCVEGHYEEAEDYMKKVEDLMILGPNCSISYERDFVGEGEAYVSFF